MRNKSPRVYRSSTITNQHGAEPHEKLPNYNQPWFGSAQSPGSARTICQASTSLPIPYSPAAENALTNRSLRILLLDDDKSFGAILKRWGAKSHLDFTVCHDLDSLGAQLNSGFDVAVIDYDLGSVTGFEIVRYLEDRDWQTPFIFVSQSELPEEEDGSPLTWNFIHKARGPQAIIQAVFDADRSNKQRNV